MVLEWHFLGIFFVEIFICCIYSCEIPVFSYAYRTVLLSRKVAIEILVGDLFMEILALIDYKL